MPLARMFFESKAKKTNRVKPSFVHSYFVTVNLCSFSVEFFHTVASLTMVKNHFAWLSPHPPMASISLHGHITLHSEELVHESSDEAHRLSLPITCFVKKAQSWTTLQIFLKQPLSANHQWQYKASIWLHLNEFWKKTALVINNNM